MNKGSKPMKVSVGLLAAACSAAVLLSGCAAGSAINPQAQSRVAQSEYPVPSAQDFPAISAAKWKQGSFPSLEALRTMRVGMGKDQVRGLLSWPHFSEGLGGVREWNYIFHFRTDDGPQYMTCQYMVRFDEDYLSTGMYWKEPQCADLLKPPPASPAPVVVPERISLAADGLFRFDGGLAADLLPEGRNKIVQLAQSLQTSTKSLQKVVVAGHTDRLGTNEYNQNLSKSRAQTVADLLVQNGIDPRVIYTAGFAATQPVVNCAGTARTPELVSCLQPNRRVVIDVTAEK